MFNIKKLLTRMGYTLAEAKVGDKSRFVVVVDKNNPNPELKPVAIGGKLVEKGK